MLINNPFFFAVLASLHEVQCNETALILSWNSFKEAFQNFNKFQATINVFKIFIFKLFFYF